MTRAAARETGMPNLCLAGGVALNCVANGKILKDGAFQRLWIQPAAGDAGGALGAALMAYYCYSDQPRRADDESDGLEGSYLGPAFTQEDIERRLQHAGAQYTILDEDAFFEACVQALTDEKVLGWFQGRMEFGPRALGARSILGDPRSPRMQSVLNLKIKYRESFRPFAPSVLREDASAWFDLQEASPYMLLVADVAKSKQLAVPAEAQVLCGIEKLGVLRSLIPAVTHVDQSARIQTVDSRHHADYYRLLQRFKTVTGCPVLINTSFNVRGEPMVGSPEDAFRCFMGTQMDALAIGRCFLRKQDQHALLRRGYAEVFALD
jgi:carbamoyltransferase